MKSVIELCYQAARTLRCQDWKNLLTVGRCSLRISIFIVIVIVIVMVMVIIIIHLSFQLMKLRMLTGRWSFVGSLGMSALNSGPLKNISITIVVVMCYRFKGSHPIILLSIFNIWILHQGKVAITVAFKVPALQNLTRPLHPPQYLQILKAPGRAKHNG